MSVRVAVTAGTTADCTQAAVLIDGITAQYLLADRGYDSNEIIDKAIKAGCKIVIPSKRNRKTQRCYNKALYRVRHLENAFLHLKQWRGIANGYTKMLTSFEAALQIRCITVWLKALT